MGVPYAEVIGDPIAHSKSPLIHKFWLGKLGLPGDYRNALVTHDGLAIYLESRCRDPHWRGCNITAPLKEKILALTQVSDSRVKAVGAANCMVRRDGAFHLYNTDVDGVSAALRLESFRCKRALIVGAGGAARAALFHLKQLGAPRVAVLARDPSKAESLREISPPKEPLALEFYGFEEVAEAIGGAHLIINASPLGSSSSAEMPEAIMNELRHAARDSTVFDMVYDPLRTRLLTAARGLRFGVVDGLEMLLGQAASAFELLFGAPAPRQHDAELRELLTR
jgi:shikimate dehydrogenase